MTTTTNTIARLSSAAMRHKTRTERIEALRDGRKERSTRIESAKTYRRHPKHRNGGQD